MKRSDLNVGDHVRVYASGTLNAWGEIVELDAEAPPQRPTHSIRVRFLAGQGPLYGRERLVAARSIIEKK